MKNITDIKVRYMTGYEERNFYSMDNHEYVTSSNMDLQNWIVTQVKNGYYPFIDIYSLEVLIDTIVTWYEVKYPNIIMDKTNSHLFEEIKLVSEKMDYKQLLLRLRRKQKFLLSGDYRSCNANGELNLTYVNEELKEKICYTVGMDFESGIIYGNDIDFDTEIVDENHLGRLKLEELFSEKEEIRIEELLKQLEYISIDCLDYTEISKIICYHNIDIELRRKVLELVALKLLYSKNTIPGMGYIRAKIFIEEFNEYIPDLYLTTSMIDEIMNRDYSKTPDYISAFSSEYEKVVKNNEKQENQKQKVLRNLFKKSK